MELLGYLLSVVMGITLGLLGGGGSILTVPILVYIFGVDPILAIPYSLFIVGTTALFGGFSYHRRGEVDLKTGSVFAIPSLLTVYLVRTQVMPRIPDPVFEIGSLAFPKAAAIMAVFAVLMVLAASSMIKAQKPQEQQAAHDLKHGIMIGIKGMIVGAVTGFVGAGGGFLIIPALVVLVGVPMRLAVGTSLFIIATNALLGFVGDLQKQVDLDWPFLIKVTLMAVIGLLAGSHFAQRIPAAKLKKGFGWFVLLMGSIILFDQLRRL